MTTKQFSSIAGLLLTATSLTASTINVTPAASTQSTGQTFTLNVQISGAANLYGYQFDIGFNSAVLKAVSVTEGAFLGSGGATIFLPGAIDNVGGTISANADILNGTLSGVSGSGNLLSVTFQALAPGTSSVPVFNVIAFDSFGLGLTIPTTGATATVIAGGGGGVPEPGTWLLLGSGLVLCAGFSSRRARWACHG